MFTRNQRITTGAEFRRVMHAGNRVKRPTVVIYAHPQQGPARYGFIVSKAVGNAVKRNRVKRQLREISRTLGPTQNLAVVMRALPASAQADFKTLSKDVVPALNSVSATLGVGS